MQTGSVLRLNTIIYSGVQKATAAGHQSGLCYRNNLLLGRGELLTKDCGLSHSLPYSTFTISNTFSFSPRFQSKRKSMAAYCAKSVFGDVSVENLITNRGNALELATPGGVFNHRNHRNFQNARMSLRRKQASNNCRIAWSSSIDAMHVKGNCFLQVGLTNLHALSYACYVAGTANSPAFDSNSSDEQFTNSTILSSKGLLGERTLKLLSGSCYLPHPAKEETGGEDAHFICVDEHVVGVADGVGGWADVGVDAGEFARELMSNSISAIQEQPGDSVDPAKVLEKAHSDTTAKGSSTACIISLSEKGLHAINLGDSGFIVIRDGSTIFRSPVQQYGFNFPYQLESGNGADLPSSGEVFMIPVTPGDIIVAGTDGLFDNLYSNEISAVVVNAVRAGLEPGVTAQNIAALARKRALDRNRQTPFSAAAQEAGYRYYGGKLDDITVVVSYITSSTDSPVSTLEPDSSVF
ncbi:probable protein phosphatase 2C 80 [Cucurbita maxima]|uniref:Protein phosphatase n=1 Tax=Cucurbita maxima TaxID=3661 RepID=A0A6J1J3C1_CUCMA|nr:probable protein phosphatase 2C 80 [Cucurbita maxima]XP_022984868.1 probable protein phosphatase 2C 80 [Cucurbita maxima]XP_022984869.1 probable protein phosphatase 2C 80 [Cucurbita maxima]